MIETLSGQKVKLRPVKEEDYEYFAGLKNNMYTQGWNQRLPPNATPEKLKKKYEEGNEKPNSATLSIETLDGILIGNISYHEGLPRHDATFGIVTGKEHWGKGYATESARATLAYGFSELEMEEIIGRAAQANTASIRVLEKLGMEYWKQDSCKGIDESAYYRIKKPV